MSLEFHCQRTKFIGIWYFPLNRRATNNQYWIKVKLIVRTGRCVCCRLFYSSHLFCSIRFRNLEFSLLKLLLLLLLLHYRHHHYYHSCLLLLLQLAGITGCLLLNIFLLFWYFQAVNLKLGRFVVVAVVVVENKKKKPKEIRTKKYIKHTINDNK